MAILVLLLLRGTECPLPARLPALPPPSRPPLLLLLAGCGRCRSRARLWFGPAGPAEGLGNGGRRERRPTGLSPLSLGCSCFSMYLRSISSIFSSFGGPWSQAASYVPPPPPGRRPPPLVPLSSALPPAPSSLRYRGKAPARHLKRSKQVNIRQKKVRFYLGLRRFPLVWSYVHRVKVHRVPLL